jgi:hypothetical protein
MLDGPLLVGEQQDEVRALAGLLPRAGKRRRGVDGRGRGR